MKKPLKKIDIRVDPECVQRGGPVICSNGESNRLWIGRLCVRVCQCVSVCVCVCVCKGWRRRRQSKWRCCQWVIVQRWMSSSRYIVCYDNYVVQLRDSCWLLLSFTKKTMASLKCFLHRQLLINCFIHLVLRLLTASIIKHQLKFHKLIVEYIKL